MTAPADRMRFASALAVLRRLTCLLETVLLALLLPRVAGEHASLLQRRTVVGLVGHQRTSDRHAQRAGLPGRAATVQGGQHVEALQALDGDQRLLDQLL